MMEVCEYAISNAEAFAEKLSRELQVLDGVSTWSPPLFFLGWGGLAVVGHISYSFFVVNCFPTHPGKHPVNHGIREAGEHPDAAVG